MLVFFKNCDDYLEEIYVVEKAPLNSFTCIINDPVLGYDVIVMG
jgi:hypothetical protein